MYRMLVVDDEYESRNTLCSCFPWNQVGFEITAQADNGRSALDYILSTGVDVVLCDIKMPVMSGIELARELHARKLKTVVVFLSGYRDFEYAQKAMAFGVRYYIIKPARYEELKNLFDELKKELDSREAAGDPAAARGALPRNASVFSMQEKLVGAVKKYIEDNYCTVTLESAAKSVHMNSSYLSQFFKQKTGSNFSDYLIDVKMKKAVELLKDISLKAYDVSEMVGYTNSKNFSRTFKNYYGMSPREYRNAKYGGKADRQNEEEILS
jgi:YesN/AraC family two-component response regulator